MTPTLLKKNAIDLVVADASPLIAIAIMDLFPALNVHAYHTHHPDNKQPLRERSDKNNEQHEAFLKEYPVNASDPDNKEFDLIETLLKGMEIPLPEGNSYLDKSGHRRQDIRVKWWTKDATTYRNYAVAQKDALNNISNNSLPDSIKKLEY